MHVNVNIFIDKLDKSLRSGLQSFVIGDGRRAEDRPCLTLGPGNHKIAVAG